MLLLTADQKRRGVVAASAGNHGLALSYHGRNLKIPVTVVMPGVSVSPSPLPPPQNACTVSSVWLWMSPSCVTLHTWLMQRRRR